MINDPLNEPLFPADIKDANSQKEQTPFAPSSEPIKLDAAYTDLPPDDGSVMRNNIKEMNPAIPDESINEYIRQQSNEKIRKAGLPNDEFSRKSGLIPELNPQGFGSSLVTGAKQTFHQSIGDIEDMFGMMGIQLGDSLGQP